MVTTRGRRVRAIGTVAVAAALLAGTFWGDDDHFPFGPFRMYSTTNKLNGTVRSTRVDAVTASGELVTIPYSDLGLRRAEVEGQIDRFLADPALLARLAEAYEHFVPRGPELHEIRLVERSHQLVGGRPVSYVDDTIATWSLE